VEAANVSLASATDKSAATGVAPALAESESFSSVREADPTIFIAEEDERTSSASVAVRLPETLNCVEALRVSAPSVAASDAVIAPACPSGSSNCAQEIRRISSYCAVLATESFYNVNDN
jgi:hypothetical protein